MNLKSEQIIGLDMDGVIIDHTELKISLAGEHGFNIEPKQTPSEIFNNIIEDEALREIKNKIYGHPGVALRSPVIEGAREGLGAIKASGVSYFLISRRGSGNIGRALLEERGLWPEFFNEDNAFFVKTPEDKDKVARELGITHYVDDKVKVLKALKSVKNTALFDPHKVSDKNIPYNRLFTWDEILEFLS